MNDRLTINEIIRVLSSLIGQVDAVGDSAIDSRIEENLKTMIDVTNWCLDRVAESSWTRNRVEGSMKDIGERAFSALCEWNDFLAGLID